MPPDLSNAEIVDLVEKVVCLSLISIAKLHDQGSAMSRDQVMTFARSLALELLTRLKKERGPTIH